MYFDRRFGDVPIPTKYVGDETCWQLNGALQFANMSFHDDEVVSSRWDGCNLIFGFDPYCWFGAQGEPAQELSITFVDAQVLRQHKWFDGPIVWWLYHELTPIKGGYEVSIEGELVFEGCYQIPQSERKAEIFIRASDIQVRIDGEILQPIPGQLAVGELINALSWNAPDARQQAAKEHIAAQSDFPYIFLVLPLGRKDCWDNCAEILCKQDDAELQPLLISMLQWLQDINWPGAQMILNRLIQVQTEIMKPALEYTVRRACDKHDDIWLEWLSRLIENQQLADALDADTLIILQAHSDIEE